MKVKHVHFTVEQDTWDRFQKIFPYWGEPSAFFKRCMFLAITHGRKIPDEEIEKIVREVT